MNQEKEQNHENAPAVSEESKTAASGVKKVGKNVGVAVLVALCH